MAQQMGSLVTPLAQMPTVNTSWLNSLAGTIGNAMDRTSAARNSQMNSVNYFPPAPSSPAQTASQGSGGFLSTLLNGLPQNQFSINPQLSLTTPRLGG